MNRINLNDVEETSLRDTPEWLLGIDNKKGMVRVPFKKPRRSPTFGKTVAMLGDSIIGRGNYGVTVNSITVDNKLATCTTALGHSLAPYQTCYLGNIDQQIFNGVKTVLTRESSTIFTFAIDSVESVAATGTNMNCLAQERISDRNWFEIANSLIGHPFHIIRNAGVSGQSLADIRARLSEILAESPDFLHFMGGINTIIATVAGQEDNILRQMQADTVAIIEATLNNNTIPIINTLLPLGPSAAGYTAARGNMVLRFNAWLRNIAYYIYPEIFLFDGWEICVNPLDGDWIAAYSTDDLHPTANGTQALGIAMATLLQDFRYRTPRSVGTQIDRFDADASNPQLEPNPLNQGTGGTAATAGGGTGTVTLTNNVPDSMTLTWTRNSAGGSCTVSTPARTDGFGDDFQVVLVATAANDAVDIVQTASLHARVNPGDKLIAECEIELAGITNLSNFYFAFEWGYSGTTYVQPAAIGSANAGQITQAGIFLLRTPIFVIPPTPGTLLTSLKTRIKLVCAGVGGVTAKISRRSIRRIEL